MIQHYVGPGGHCLATSQNVVAWNATRAEAFTILSRIEGVDPDAVLNSNVDALTFKATTASALANESMYVSAAIESMEASSAVEQLHARLDLLLTVTEDLRSERKRANDLAAAQLAERQAASEKVEREHRERVAHEAAVKQAALDAEAQKLKWSRKLVRFMDGSADLLDVTAKPNVVLRRFKPGEEIPAEVRGFE
jgi:hypothetical protein